MPKFNPARHISGWQALGALLVIIGFGALAAFASASAKASLPGGGDPGGDACTYGAQSITFIAATATSSPYISVSQNLSCDKVGAKIVGSDWLQQWAPSNGSWNLTNGVWSKTTYGGQTIGGEVLCYYPSLSGTTFAFRGYAMWRVYFPDGIEQDYSSPTAERGMPCDQINHV